MTVRTPHSDLIVLTEAAMAVALALVLGAMRVVELPSGGSVAFGTLPLLALALVRGVRVGMLAATCAGLAHALAGGTIIHPVQLLLDYGLAYTVLGFAGLAAATSIVQVRLVVIGCGALQLACFTTSGVIFFGDQLGEHAMLASLVYNAATVVPETLLAVLLVPTVVRAIARANPAEGWRLGLIDPPMTSARVRRLSAMSASHLVPIVNSDGRRPRDVRNTPPHAAPVSSLPPTPTLTPGTGPRRAPTSVITRRAASFSRTPLFASSAMRPSARRPAS